MDENILNRITSLTEEITKLKIENERIKKELKHYKELNKYRNRNLDQNFLIDWNKEE